MSHPIFTSNEPVQGAGASLPFIDDTDFIESLTVDQRAYFLHRMRERQTDLQAAMRELATGLSIVNEMHDAAARGVTCLAPSEGER